MVDLMMWSIISGLLVGAALGYFISTVQLTRRIFVSSPKSVAINAGHKKAQSKEPLQIEKLADLRKKFKMVLVVRNDLKMGKGKIAAQCSHATLGLYKKLLKRAPRALNRWEYCAQPKVVVKIESEAEMLVLQERAKSLQLPTHITIDAGKTQIAPNSRTVMAILGPVDNVDEVTGGLKLM
ncbi:PREDICTED: peptidyl-tRNA hydrolase 2, mitochondrial [Camelina sativa]|uniref:peptidyl-tRNA hydrolase n=1 Tax=Camelina sativa TaxID=90675 RepID=A0ABM0YRZ3_CAMSA|nr:PREDICTED: peptidyl-tRNA hydrolase 2, mitochondrial [Camelina sativa]XP_010505037.1 PREDICTED: peptidyl-tRNA hydrolase 2, mitochondrial [Camelina sativa]